MGDIRRYNVVFRGTAEAGAYEGIITWSSYSSKEAFDKHNKQAEQEVIAEGVTEDEAVKLVGTTSVEARLRVVAEKSKNDEGKVSLRILGQELQMLMFMLKDSSQCVP